jgi:NAD(P)-dependent dehydrogenase (short-subunit alcohol dehydrogenase family)/acyl carrier protein
MGLDSDLGIDSIKRVEILSEMQERIPGLPEAKPEDLGRFQMLRDVVTFLGAVSVAVATPQVSATPSSAVEQTLLAVVSEKTGYPVEMLDLDMGLDSDLGIDSIKRVEILSAMQEQMPGLPEAKPEDLGRFQTLRDVVTFLSGSVAAAPVQAETVMPPKEAAKAVEPSIEYGIDRRVLTAVPLAQEQNAVEIADEAEFWVSDNGTDLTTCIVDELRTRNFAAKKIALDDLSHIKVPETLGGLVIVSPEDAHSLFLKSAFALLQKAAPALRKAAKQGGAVLVTVSRLDGAFGLGTLDIQAEPASGGLAGLAKTASHEWPDVRCKAIDLAADFDLVADAATAVVDEVLSTGVLEVGVSQSRRLTLRLEPQPIGAGLAASPVEPGDVVVVSGGARGVTAEVAVALSKAWRPTLLLLGRSKRPSGEPAWLAGLDSEAAIKKALLAKKRSLTPKKLDAEYRSVEANREIQRTIARIEEAGGKAVYCPCDVRDADAVRAIVEKAREEYGPVRGLIHGAGVIADRLIEDKTVEQFGEVYGTKVEGLQALLDAVGSDDLKFMVLFSSSTGRFGRTGQVDYAVANEVLNKTAQQQSRFRPNCRVVSVNWGPWAGGMVTPSLRKVFEQEGVELIDLQAGAEYLMREIAQPPVSPCEVVILGAKREVSRTALSEAFTLDVDVKRFPILASHVMDGHAVVPVALMAEWLAHGALHGNPGLRFTGLDGLRVYKGIVLNPGETRALRVCAGKAEKAGAAQRVVMELHGADASGRDVLHARATVVLGSQFESNECRIGAFPTRPLALKIGDIYETKRLFHGPGLQALESIKGCSIEGIVARAKPSPAPAQWIEGPLRNSWLADPMALDASFQSMIVWSFETNGSGSLPTALGTYRQFRAAYPKKGVKIAARIKERTAHRAVADVEFVDPDSGQLVARIEDYECVIDPSLNEAFQKNELSGE